MLSLESYVARFGRVGSDLLTRSRSHRILRIALVAALIAYQPGSTYLQAAGNCQVIREVKTNNNQSCQCSDGQCPPMKLIRDYLKCGDAATGQQGQDGDCVSEVRTIGNLVHCESNANYMALMMWAGGFVGCMFTCGAIPASGPAVPFAILKCLACIATFSSAPAIGPCRFIYCTSGGRGKDIPGNVATGLSGKPCVGGQDAPAI